MRKTFPFLLGCPFILNAWQLMKTTWSRSLLICIAHFQGLFGEAAFYYKNPGSNVLAGERSILAGILMRHIAMAQSMGRFIIRGLYCLNCRFPLTKFDDDEPDKVSIHINCLVRELMMEKKIHGTKVWTLITQTLDGHWVGYCF